MVKCQIENNGISFVQYSTKAFVQKNNMRLICIHQSADLYGSDRSFLQVLEFFVKSGRFSEITVVLPRKGPLVEKIEELNVNVKYLSLSLLSKTYLKKLQWGKILFPLLAFSSKKKLLQSYDFVYVNTSVILDFYLIAPFISTKKAIHIREIPTKWLSKILSFFLKKSGATVLFNSYSTAKGFDPLPDSHVVHNSFEGFGPQKSATFQEQESENLKVLLIGRINHWKGQDFALEAISLLKNKQLTLRLVGDTSAGNEDLVTKLEEQAKRLGVTSQVEFTGFSADPVHHYEWADVLIVPSKKPEPFGRIAIEAMSLSKPVIAANHGGLPEIIEHGKSGYLFKPNDIASFNECLTIYLQDRATLKEHGVNAKLRYEDHFSVRTMYERLESILFTEKGLR